MPTAMHLLVARGPTSSGGECAGILPRHECGVPRGVTKRAAQTLTIKVQNGYRDDDRRGNTSD